MASPQQILTQPWQLIFCHNNLTRHGAIAIEARANGNCYSLSWENFATKKSWQKIAKPCKN